MLLQGDAVQGPTSGARCLLPLQDGRAVAQPRGDWLPCCPPWPAEDREGDWGDAGGEEGVADDFFD